MQSYTQKHLILRMLQLVVFICLINWVAVIFHWYSIIWWFDIPMHFFGGIFIGMLYVYFLVRWGAPVWSVKTFILGLIAVFVVGLLWEVFEFSLDTWISFRPQQPLDTLSDLCFDIAGGALALWYASRRFLKSNADGNFSDTQV